MVAAAGEQHQIVGGHVVDGVGGGQPVENARCDGQFTGAAGRRAVDPRQGPCRAHAAGGRALDAEVFAAGGTFGRAGAGAAQGAIGQSAPQKHLNRDAQRHVSLVPQHVQPGGGRQRGDAIEGLFLRQSDEEVQLERAGEVLGEDAAQAAVARIDAAEQFALVQPGGDRVITLPGARAPQWLLVGQDLREPIPVGHIRQPHHPIQHRQTRAVVEQLPHGDRFLAVRGEFRPVLRDRRLVVEHPTRDGTRHGECRHPLRRGEDRNHGVALPRQLSAAIAEPRPQIHHRPVPVVDGHGRADLAESGEVASKRVRDRLETARHLTVYLSNLAHSATDGNGHRCGVVRCPPGSETDQAAWIRELSAK
ncbi:hypothetical protein B7C42_08287 [Nocardia cerradoensis]|uniref:Uncharacterized protein n=1 Tax=Nocardia cerradoensis TaxID=85688 RepID=A0A231GSP6_9NOCA|nr:hypothetical protein B7C42_08287 [Nocardia cerradoensis]